MAFRSCSRLASATASATAPTSGSAAGRPPPLTARHYARLGTLWPKDRLRPGTSFHELFLKAREAQIVADEGAAAAAGADGPVQISPQKALARQKELCEVNALYALVDNRFSKKYPISQDLLRPTSNPTYYEDLLKDFDAAPTRRWWQLWTLKFKSMFNRQATSLTTELTDRRPKRLPKKTCKKPSGSHTRTKTARCTVRVHTDGKLARTPKAGADAASRAPAQDTTGPSALRHQQAGTLEASIAGSSRRSGGSDTTTAAALAAAAVEKEVGKPREERPYTEFHPELDIHAPLLVFSTEELNAELLSQQTRGAGEDAAAKAVRRSPSKNPSRNLAPIPAPLPIYTNHDRLKLHKPSFRKIDTYSQFEQDRDVSVNYVDKNLANVGFQETDQFIRPQHSYIRQSDSMPARMLDKGLLNEVSLGRVEYDMDMQDMHWLNAVNNQRTTEGLNPVRPAYFEIAMTLIDREWHQFEQKIPKTTNPTVRTARARSSSATAVKGETLGAAEDPDTTCAVCDNGDCENSNAIVFCDGCDMAVHQECYGVPFIPEGQWLCRKCQFLGTASDSPGCIFCPNTEGAFKQTDRLKWAHLICALWIPEIAVANTTFMEPVCDVEAVPASRWKLCCYICNQKMGACIQCSSKNCFTAFHVTCARRAKLFFQMRSDEGDLSFLSTTTLSAYCDRHGPADWNREHKVKQCLVAAQKYYADMLKGKRWQDSRDAALAGTSNPSINGDSNSTATNVTITKKKLDQIVRRSWRLPAGAPVVPAKLYNRVDQAMSRFSITKRKVFIAAVCKYWTLKRESRRGASLLKRLPASQIGGASAELMKRDFKLSTSGAGPGPGRLMLQQRVEFARKLERDLEMLEQICEKVRDGENIRAEQMKNLQTIVEMTCFPISPLLGPVLRKAADGDHKHYFLPGFLEMEERLSRQYYTSVYAFTKDLWTVLCVGTETHTIHHVAQRLKEFKTTHSVTPELKDKKICARRVFRVVFPMLVEVLAKEKELLPGSDQKPVDGGEVDIVVDGEYGKHLLDIDLGLTDPDMSPLLTGTFAHPGTPRNGMNGFATPHFSEGDPRRLPFQAPLSSSTRVLNSSNMVSTPEREATVVAPDGPPGVSTSEQMPDPSQPPGKKTAAHAANVIAGESQAGASEIALKSASTTEGSWPSQQTGSSAGITVPITGSGTAGPAPIQSRVLGPEEEQSYGPGARGGVPWYLDPRRWSD